MDFFDNPNFRINKYFLLCIGQWPYQTSVPKHLIQFLTITSLIFCLLPSVAGLYAVWGNAAAVVECLPPIFTAFGCFVYTIVYITKEKKMKYLLEQIKNDWHLLSIGEEIEIISNYARNGRIYTTLYAGCVGGTAIIYVTLSLTPQFFDIILPLNESRPKVMPFPVEYFVDQEKYYYWITLHILIIAITETSVLVGSESLLAVFVEHACGMFAIIGNRLKSIDKVSLIKNGEDATYNIMILCIQQHNRTIEFCDSIESCFYMCLFFTVGFNSILISATLLQAVVNLNKVHDAVKFGTFSGALIVHLFFNSLPAQRLMDHSVGVADEMYDGLWYQLPLKSKKLLSMIIMRSSIPCTITAGKMCTMSLKSFCVILQTSFSYFTLLSSFRA